MAMWLTADPGANELLERDPLALLVGMLLDQRIAGCMARRYVRSDLPATCEAGQA